MKRQCENVLDTWVHILDLFPPEWRLLKTSCSHLGCASDEYDEYMPLCSFVFL